MQQTKELSPFQKKLLQNKNANIKEIDKAIAQFQKRQNEGVFNIEQEKVAHFYNLITDAIDNKKGVLVYFDYDCDGITSGLMMIELISKIALDRVDQKHATEFLGKNIKWYSPTRDDGYGITKEYIDSVTGQNKFDLVITCDCGTQEGMEAVFENNEYLNKFFAFDHHANGDFSKYPNVINPNIDGKLPISTGILLYRFTEALNRQYSKNFNPCADLATISAIGDMASTNSNRDILHRGLNEIHNAKVEYLKLETSKNEIKTKALQKYEEFNDLSFIEETQDELREIEKKQEMLNGVLRRSRPVYDLFFNGLHNVKISTRDIAFSVVAVVNSLNRLHMNNDLAVSLLGKLSVSNQADYNNLAQNYYLLQNLKTTRKEESLRGTKQAKALYEKMAKGEPLLFFNMKNDTLLGVCGLIAQRMKEYTGTDVIVAAQTKDGSIHFSGRGENVHTNLSILHEFIASKGENNVFAFGGHLKALGGRIFDVEKFTNYLKEAKEQSIFIKAHENKIHSLVDTNVILSNPVTLFEYEELCKYLSSKLHGISYGKNFLVPVLISNGTIANLNRVAQKVKNSEFVFINFTQRRIVDGEADYVNLNFITDSTSAKELIRNSNMEQNGQRKFPIFYVAMNDNALSGENKYSGIITYAGRESVESFVKRAAKIANSIDAPNLIQVDNDMASIRRQRGEDDGGLKDKSKLTPGM